MNTRNLILKVSYGLIAVLIIVIIGFLVYQHRQNRQIVQNKEPAPLAATVSDSNTLNDNNTLLPVAEGGREQLAAEVDELKYQLDAAEEELDMARGQLADELTRKDETSERMGPPPGAELQTPEGKKRMRNSFKNGFYTEYGSLFKEFNLSAEEIDQVKDLLADWQVARLELTYEMGNLSLMTEEERKNLQKQLVDQDSQKDTALEALLGSDDFQTYASYEDRSYERSMIQGFNENLSLDDALTADQKTSLVEALYNKRQDTLSQLGFDEEAPYGFYYMDNFMEINRLVNDEYIKAVEEAGLSESQEKKLKLFLERVM